MQISFAQLVDIKNATRYFRAVLNLLYIKTGFVALSHIRKMMFVIALSSPHHVNCVKHAYRLTNVE